MRRLAALALAAFAAAASAQAAAPAPAAPSPARAKRIRIAVLDLGSFGIEEKERALLSEVALTAAGASALIETIGKSDVAALLGFEKQKQMMGCGDDFSCIAEVGGALGAEYILTGSVGNIGELHRVDVKLVEVKKARVASRAGETVSGGVASLVAAVQRSVRQALLPIDPSLAPAPAEPTRLSGRRVKALWIGGAGLLCLGGAGTFGLLARSSYRDLEDASAAQDSSAWDAAKSRLERRNLLADGLLGVGAAGVGIGAWLWFTGGRAPAQVSVAPLEGGALLLVGGVMP